VSALAALFCFDTARLSTRLDAEGVFVPLEEQDRTRWDWALIERGLGHLAASAAGDRMSRWHLEAGIACEHAVAPSVRATDWGRIVAFYDLLVAQAPGPSATGSRRAAVSSSRSPATRSWPATRSTGRPWPTCSVGPTSTARRGRVTSARSSSPGARPNGPHTGGACTSSKLRSGASGSGRPCSSS
jgi:hypothetical protein